MNQLFHPDSSFRAYASDLFPATIAKRALTTILCLSFGIFCKGLGAEMKRETRSHGSEQSATPKVEAPRFLTLHAAYDRAIATDQSLRKAYIEIQKARLLRWKPLASLEPKISGTFGTSDRRRHGDAQSRLTDSLVSSTDASSSLTGTRNFTENSLIRPTSPASESFSRSTDTFVDVPREDDDLKSSRGFSNDMSEDRAALIVRQPLLDLTIFPAYRAGVLAEKSARLNFQSAMRDVLLGVARAYSEAGKSEQLVTVAQQTIELAQRQQVVANQRLEVGTAMEIDVLRADAHFERAQRALAVAEGGRLRARATLARILNMPSTDFVLGPLPEVAPNRESLSQLIAKASGLREDYEASGVAISGRVERRKEVEAGFAPTVSAELRVASTSDSESISSNIRSERSIDRRENISRDVAFQSNGSERIFRNGQPLTSPRTRIVTEHGAGPGSFSRNERHSARSSSNLSANGTEWQAVLYVHVPFGATNSLDLRQAKWNVAEAEMDREILRKKIEQEVCDAFIQVQILVKSMRSLEAEKNAMERNYKNLQNLYEAGTANSVDLLIALRDLTAARTQLVADRYDYAFALLSLERAAGQFEDARVRRATAERLSEPARSSSRQALTIK